MSTLATPAESFLQSLFRLVQTVRIHGDSNRLLQECGQAFLHALTPYAGEGEITLQVSRDRLFLQGEKIKPNSSNSRLLGNLLDLLVSLGLQGFKFQADPARIPLAEILAFAHILQEAGGRAVPLGHLTEKLELAQLHWVEVLFAPVNQEQQRRNGQSAAERGLQTYALAIASLQEIAEKFMKNKRPGTSRSVRVVQDMVDFIMEDDRIVMGLSTIRDHDDYTYTHSVNVSLLAMLFGNAIGLSRHSLERLGICGLFHDLGKISIPLNILNKNGKLDEREFAEIRRHPLNGVQQVVKLQAPRDLRAKTLLAPFEHHLKFDLSGYPVTPRRTPLSLFGRLLAIVDVYDALTSARIYRPVAMSPDTALGIMLQGSGTDFDPVLLKYFVNMLGAYPIGTLLSLDSGELGLVYDKPACGERDRPLVLLLVPRDDGDFDGGEVIDLSETNEDGQGFRRSITRSMHPSVMGIQPSRFLL